MATHIMHYGTAEHLPSGEWEVIETLDVAYFCGNLCFGDEVRNLTRNAFTEVGPGQWCGLAAGAGSYAFAEGGAHPAPSYPDYDVHCGSCGHLLHHGE